MRRIDGKNILEEEKLFLFLLLVPPLCNLFSSVAVRNEEFIEMKQIPLKWRRMGMLIKNCSGGMGSSMGDYADAVGRKQRKQACPVPTASAIFFFALLLSLICQNGPSVLLFARMVLGRFLLGLAQIEIFFVFWFMFCLFFFVWAEALFCNNNNNNNNNGKRKRGDKNGCSQSVISLA